jgi:hypothetical protein
LHRDPGRLARPVKQFRQLAVSPCAPSDPGRLARPVKQFSRLARACGFLPDPGRLARPVKEFPRLARELLPRPGKPAGVAKPGWFVA